MDITKDHVAIVTGGASGLGAATVAALRDAGAQVVIFDMNADMGDCLLYTSPSPRDKRQSRMPSSA